MDILALLITISFIVYLAEKLFSPIVEERETYVTYVRSQDDEKDATPEEW